MVMIGDAAVFAIAQVARSLLDELAALRAEGAALRRELEGWADEADAEGTRPTLPVPLPAPRTTLPVPDYGYDYLSA